MARTPSHRQGLGKLVTFEAQSRTARAWRTIATFDDRGSAIAEAERTLRAHRTPAVRVIQVLYNDATSECQEYTIFRATSFDDDGRHAQNGAGKAETGRAEGADDGEEGSGGATSRRWSRWMPDWPTTGLTLSLALLCFFVLVYWMR